MRYVSAIIASLLAGVVPAAQPAAAQIPDSSLVGHCAPATAEAFLDVNDVRAKILNNGGLFWNAGGANVYEVPKGSGLSSLFAASLWLGGIIDDEYRTAGTTYGPYELWPGPIPEDGSVPDDCAAYDRIHELTYDSGVTKPESSVTDAMRQWPADLGAPYSDTNGVPGYQPEDGDRPLMYGDQMLWWVMNDRGNIHEDITSDPLGIDVRVAAFAYDLPGPLRTTTLYRYEITNRNDRPIEDLFFGIFVDPDVGLATDDYVGTDTTLGMIFSYNADNDDEGEYGEAPPAVGLTLISSSHEPDADFERVSPQTLPGFNYSNWHGSCNYLYCYPNAEMAYNILVARFRDGEKLKLGGSGRAYSDTPTDYFMPGDPVTGAYWSERNVDGQGGATHPSDRRIFGSFGPVDLDPDETFTTVMAIVWARGSSNLDSVTRLREGVGILRESAELFTAARTSEQDFPWNEAPPEAPPPIPFAASIYPNPATDEVMLRLGVPHRLDVRVRVFDALGRPMTVVVDSRLDAGDRRYTLEVADWPHGVYLVRIQLDHITETRRLVVMR